MSMFAAGGGGMGAMGGAAAAGGGVPYVNIAFAVAGGILGGLGTIKKNKALKGWAQENMRRIDQALTNARVDTNRGLAALYRESQGELTSLLNIAPEGLSAVETLASRVVGGVASDVYAINEGQRRVEQTAAQQKTDVATEASSQMKNWFIESNIAAAKGFSDFGSVMDLASEYSQTGDIATMQAALGGDQRAAADMAVEISRKRLRSADLRTQWMRGRVDTMMGEIANSSIGDIHRNISLYGLYRNR